MHSKDVKPGIYLRARLLRLSSLSDIFLITCHLSLIRNSVELQTLKVVRVSERAYTTEGYPLSLTSHLAEVLTPEIRLCGRCSLLEQSYEIPCLVVSHLYVLSSPPPL